MSHWGIPIPWEGAESVLSQKTCRRFIFLASVSRKMLSSKSITYRLLLIAALSFCAEGHAMCQDSQHIDTVLIEQTTALDEVTVIAAPLDKDIIVPQTLSGERLRSMNSLNVADAIRYFSGVQIKDYGGVGGIKTINVRSMGSQHTGVYYNGIQLGNAQNGQVDLGKFSLENIDEIRLFNGQKSDILQSAREFGSAGNVYLTTRRPKFAPGRKSHIRASLKAGSFALINPSMLVDVKLTDNMSLTMNAEVVHSNGRYKFRYRKTTPDGTVAYDTTAIRHNGDVNAVRAEVGLNHYYTSSGYWKLNAYHYNSERGVPGAIVNNVWRNGERLWDRNTFLQAQWSDEFFNRWTSKVNAKYACDYTHYINNDTRLLPADNEYLQHEAYISWSNKVMLFDWWDIAAAYDIQYNGLRQYMTADRLSQWYSLAAAFNCKGYLRAQASILGTTVTDFADKNKKTKAQTKTTTQFTPGMFFSYQPTLRAKLKINAFYKQAYRFPTFNDLYYTDMGAADLKPEKATQHDVGISYDADFKNAKVHPDGTGLTLSINADYYYNKVTDKIIAYPKGQQFRWTMLNLGLVKIHGVDAKATADWGIGKGWRWMVTAQYTYQDARDVTNSHDNYYQHQIPYIPHHSGSVTTMLQWKGYSLNYSFIYVGERYNQQENIPANYVQPWYTHDLSIAAQWDIKDVKLRVNADINNLLGQDYEVITNYPMPKTNFRIGVTVEY